MVEGSCQSWILDSKKVGKMNNDPLPNQWTEVLPRWMSWNQEEVVWGYDIDLYA